MRLLLILLFFTLTTLGQTTQTFDQEIDTINRWVERGLKENDTALINKGFYRLSKIKNDSILKERAIHFGLQGFFAEDTLALSRAQKILKQLYKRDKDSATLAKHYHYKALVYRNSFVLDSSFYYYRASKNVSAAIYDTMQVVRRLLSMANMQMEIQDNKGAEETIIEGLRYLEPRKENRYKNNFYNALAIIYSRNEEYGKALEMFKASEKHVFKIKDKYRREKQLLYLFNNIGDLELGRRNYKTAIKYLNKGLQIDSVRQKHPTVYAMLLGNYADCLYALGDKKEYYKLASRVIKVREELKDFHGIAFSLAHVAYSYNLDGNKQQAKSYALKAYNLAKKTKQGPVMVKALGVLSNVESPKQAKKYFEEYISLNDSIVKETNKTRSQFTRIRYETEKKEAENTALELKLSQQELRTEREKQQKTIALFFGVIVFSVLIIGYLSYRNKQKKILYQAQLDKAIVRENERRQIAKSLHDEVAGDLRSLHKKLEKNHQDSEAKELDKIKNNVRNLSHKLSSVSFDDVSFKEQLTSLISDYFSTDFRIKQIGVSKINFDRINKPILRALFLSIRESLQNSYKYAEASLFTIHFIENKEAIEVILSDNGIGFNTSEINTGIGLKNIKERVEELNGTFQISSSKKGTKTHIIIPQNEK